MKRAHVEMGSQQRVRRPLRWRVMAGMQGSVQVYGTSGRVFWIGLALSNVVLRASELFATKVNGCTINYTVCGGGCGVFRDNEQWAERR